jgi:putative membrane protein
MPSFFAFLHFAAAFTVFATLVLEHSLLEDPLTLASAQRLQKTDILFGISAGLVLVIGWSRVFLYEKGSYYYTHNAAFLAKMGCFILVGLISIIPTLEFIAWRPATRQGMCPSLTPAKLRRLKLCIRLELLLIFVMIFCATLMAKGIGTFGI